LNTPNLTAAYNAVFLEPNPFLTGLTIYIEVSLVYDLGERSGYFLLNNDDFFDGGS
jgi:hypothetical protein